MYIHRILYNKYRINILLRYRIKIYKIYYLDYT